MDVACGTERRAHGRATLARCVADRRPGTFLDGGAIVVRESTFGHIGQPLHGGIDFLSVLLPAGYFSEVDRAGTNLAMDRTVASAHRHDRDAVGTVFAPTVFIPVADVCAKVGVLRLEATLRVAEGSRGVDARPVVIGDSFNNLEEANTN